MQGDSAAGSLNGFFGKNGITPEEIVLVTVMIHILVVDDDKNTRRLLRAVRRWLDAGTAARFVCTLKFQGETDHEIARAFAALPYSRLMHLSCNRHELTWVCRLPTRTK